MGCACSSQNSVPILPLPPVLGEYSLPCPVRPHEAAIAAALQPLLPTSERGALPSPAVVTNDILTILHPRQINRLPAPVPHAFRWFAWQYLSGGCELEQQQPGLYEALLCLGPAVSPASADATIRHDAHRTLPFVPLFGSLARPGPGQSQLYRILTAYAHLDTALGYTQGLNFVAGILLLAGLSEAAAFYAFASLMLRAGVRQLYTDGLPLAIHANAELERLLEATSPRLAAHLADLGVTPPLYATPWLLSAFVSSPLPPSTVLRVWDWILTKVAPVGPLPSFACDVAERIRRTAAVTHITSPVSPSATHGPLDSARIGHPPTSSPTSALNCRVSALVAAPSIGDAASKALLAALLPCCLALVKAHERELCDATDLDDAYALIKDDYEHLPQLHDNDNDAGDGDATSPVRTADAGSTPAVTAVSDLSEERVRHAAHGCASSPATPSPPKARASQVYPLDVSESGATPNNGLWISPVTPVSNDHPTESNSRQQRLLPAPRTSDCAVTSTADPVDPPPFNTGSRELEQGRRVASPPVLRPGASQRLTFEDTPPTERTALPQHNVNIGIDFVGTALDSCSDELDSTMSIDPQRRQGQLSSTRLHLALPSLPVSPPHDVNTPSAPASRRSSRSVPPLSMGLAVTAATINSPHNVPSLRADVTSTEVPMGGNVSSPLHFLRSRSLSGDAAWAPISAAGRTLAWMTPDQTHSADQRHEHAVIDVTDTPTSAVPATATQVPRRLSLQSIPSAAQALATNQAASHRHSSVALPRHSAHNIALLLPNVGLKAPPTPDSGSRGAVASAPSTSRSAGHQRRMHEIDQQRVATISSDTPARVNRSSSNLSLALTTALSTIASTVVPAAIRIRQSIAMAMPGTSRSNSDHLEEERVGSTPTAVRTWLQRQQRLGSDVPELDVGLGLPLSPQSDLAGASPEAPTERRLSSVSTIQPAAPATPVVDMPQQDALPPTPRGGHTYRPTVPIYGLTPERSLAEFGAAASLRFEAVDEARLCMAAMVRRDAEQSSVPPTAVPAAAAPADGAGARVPINAAVDRTSTTTNRPKGDDEMEERKLTDLHPSPMPMRRPSQTSRGDLAHHRLHPPRRRGIFEASLGYRIDATALAAVTVAASADAQHERLVGVSAGDRGAREHGPLQPTSTFICDGRPCSEWATPYRFSTLLQTQL